LQQHAEIFRIKAEQMEVSLSFDPERGEKEASQEAETDESPSTLRRSGRKRRPVGGG
jgi:hypothetical protein